MTKKRKRSASDSNPSAVGESSGFILGGEPMIAEDSLAVMHEGIPNAFVKVLLQNQIVPKRILVRSELLRGLLRSLTQTLNIELRYADELSSIDEAKRIPAFSYASRRIRGPR